VLPVLHGKLGEDGAMQGLLELPGIPGSGDYASQAAADIDNTPPELRSHARLNSHINSLSHFRHSNNSPFPAAGR
jgi:D-alanine-D-alanine ligase-like ATP-grasp enzyme